MIDDELTPEQLAEIEAESAAGHDAYGDTALALLAMLRRRDERLAALDAEAPGAEGGEG